MKKYISIGEMSKLNNVSIQTLRHYDKLGLLKPAYIDEQSRYRYYMIEQIPYIDVIKGLKATGLSLEEIKAIVVENENLEELLLKLKNQLVHMDEKINELHTARHSLAHKISSIQSSLERKDYGHIYRKNLEKRTCFYLSLENERQDLIQDENLILKLRDLGLLMEKEAVVEGNIGVTSSIQNGKVVYEEIFTLMNETTSLTHHEQIKVIPSGEYACMLYRGIDTDPTMYYKQLENYVKEHCAIVPNTYYEISLVSGIITANPDDYIVEIQICIK